MRYPSSGHETKTWTFVTRAFATQSRLIGQCRHHSDRTAGDFDAEEHGITFRGNQRCRLDRRSRLQHALHVGVIFERADAGDADFSFTHRLRTGRQRAHGQGIGSALDPGGGIARKNRDARPIDQRPLPILRVGFTNQCDVRASTSRGDQGRLRAHRRARS